MVAYLVVSVSAFSAASSAAAASSATTTTSAAFGGAGALRAPFVVVVAEEAAAADDAAEGANSGITWVPPGAPGAIHRDGYWAPTSHPQGWHEPSTGMAAALWNPPFPAIKLFQLFGSLEYRTLEPVVPFSSP